MEFIDFHGFFPYGDYLFEWTRLYNMLNKARVKPPKERKGTPMKNLIALLLALVMMLSMALTGCGNVEPDPTEPPKASDSVQQPGDDAKEPDVPAEPVKLTVWVQTQTKVADYNDNEMTRWLEEHANVDLEVTAIPAADFNTKVNMALTAGAVEDLPDIIMSYKAMAATSVMEWADAGNILPLTEYYNDAELAKNINEAIERTGVDYTAHLYMPDGNIYSIGNYNQSYGNEYPGKIWINKVWLDKLEMEIPTTVEEFYNVLKAVAETDLNGNGKNDEIPFAGSTGTKYGKYMEAIMNGYFYAGDKNGVYNIVEDGVVSSGATTEEFKESLKFLRKMFQEGLVLKESLTMNDDQFLTLANTEDNTVFSFVYSSPSGFTDEDRRSEYIAINPLIGPEGVQYSTYHQSVGNHCFFITANCKNPEAAFKVGDLMSSEYIGISSRFGLQGTDWDYPQDAKNVDEWESAMSQFPLYVVLYDADNFWAAKEPTHNSWMQTGPYVRQYAIANGMSVKKGAVSSSTENQNQAQINYQEGGYAPKEHIPVLVYNEDESVIVAEAQSALASYIGEFIGAVMMGNKNLEGDWDAFQSELEKIGLSDYLAAVQSAYDRMYK